VCERCRGQQKVTRRSEGMWGAKRGVRICRVWVVRGAVWQRGAVQRSRLSPVRVVVPTRRAHPAEESVLLHGARRESKKTSCYRHVNAREKR